MISAARLARMQAAVAGLRPTPCTIARNTPTADGMGGWTDGWATLTTTTCRVMSAAQTIQETTQEGRLADVVRWTIALAPGTDITDRDRIVALGVTYEVIGVLGPKTYEVERLVQCEVTG